jgi:glutamate 5-kinase
MAIYQKEFAKYGIQIGQILLSHEDLAHRTSFLNTRATVMQLLELGILPIINENDSVSTEEIEFGDNDRLAVLMANLVEAERGIFLTTAEGLLDMNRSKQLIPVVKKIDRNILSMARSGNNMGRGGMASKLISIDSMARAGKNATLAHGKTPSILKRWFAGESVGTLFQARKTKKSSRELWMRQNLKPRGRIVVDEGARQAMCKKKASLLSVGVLGVKGRFGAGQLVSLECEGKSFARGMIRFSSDQVRSIVGLSKEAASILLELKNKPCHLIHRNDVVIMESEVGS